MARGFAREDLYTVVLEHFLTDTADHADLVLPATTQLEHWDAHTAYGHTYALLNQPEAALDSYDRATQLDSELGWAWQSKARILRALGREEEAQRALRRAELLGDD